MASYDDEKGVPAYSTGPMGKSSSHDSPSGGGRRKSSVVTPEILTGEIYDTRYESTKRGLKSRHAQMIALGGT
ncbi:hypothetical protein LTR53_020070, partial [Teratosphaeriaceae sp. CCFEE 6253]